MNAVPHVVLAAGGTGGHVFPAEALGAELKARGVWPILFTDPRGASHRQASSALSNVRAIRSGAFAGRSPIDRIRGLIDVGLGSIEAWRALRDVAPACVVGFGGYASLPTMLAATRMRLPSIIHEQNAVLGRANRLVAGRVNRIATVYAQVAGLPKGAELGLVRTGMPVRPAFAAMRDRAYVAPTADEPVRVLVLGGSQGARVFSEIIPAALEKMDPAVRRRLHLSQQCRPETLDAVTEHYRRLGIDADLKSFFNDVPERLAAAHLLVVRSGASTVAELTYVGRPAILMPYPYAADDHQSANARALEAAGACWRMEQSGLTVDALAQRMESLITDPAALAAAASAARAMGVQQAASRLADLVASVIGADDLILTDDGGVTS